jgi:hypothetical protein
VRGEVVGTAIGISIFSAIAIASSFMDCVHHFGYSFVGAFSMDGDVMMRTVFHLQDVIAILINVHFKLLASR